ncbi:hypothetical protein OIU77_001830 [Salix suchowensis]|uniref:Band 7 domain-containing protein n=1 Tax=Salix suchowensis TaxID=1278906 RepID=A0ABQ9B4Y2_9ROSI|nr:hypothetical protein OIU77_001830 [Salix suchowensis]
MLLLRNSLESLMMCWSLDATACLGVLDTKWPVNFLFVCNNSMLDVKQKLRIMYLSQLLHLFSIVPWHRKHLMPSISSPTPRHKSRPMCFDVIRASVPKLHLDATFEQKNDIAKAVEDELEKAMSAYGFEIVQTLIVDIEPDINVKRAMNEINAAARMRVAANEKAEAEKILQIKRAEGEAESKYLSGLGIARQRQAIVDGLRDSVLAFSENVPGTSAKDVMDMVLVTQYFDTMKEIGASSKSSSVFIPHGPGAVRDIASQIRDGLLQGNSSQQ